MQSRPQRHSSFGAVSEPATPLPLSFRGQQLLSETGSGDGWAEPAPPRLDSDVGHYALDRKVWRHAHECCAALYLCCFTCNLHYACRPVLVALLLPLRERTFRL